MERRNGSSQKSEIIRESVRMERVRGGRNASFGRIAAAGGEKISRRVPACCNVHTKHRDLEWTSSNSIPALVVSIDGEDLTIRESEENLALKYILPTSSGSMELRHFRALLYVFQHSLETRTPGLINLRVRHDNPLVAVLENVDGASLHGRARSVWGENSLAS